MSDLLLKGLDLLFMALNFSQTTTERKPEAEYVQQLCAHVPQKYPNIAIRYGQHFRLLDLPVELQLIIFGERHSSHHLVCIQLT